MSNNASPWQKSEFRESALKFRDGGMNATQIATALNTFYPKAVVTSEGVRSWFRRNQPKLADNILTAKAPVGPVASTPQFEQPIGRGFQDVRNTCPVNPLRVAVFDLECTALDAVFGRILCGVIQLYGPDELVVLRADDYASWKAGKRSDDKDLVADILAVLEKADVVFAHNGTNYDYPFLRTRAMIHGLPAVQPKKIIDPLPKSRKDFRFG